MEGLWVIAVLLWLGCAVAAGVISGRKNTGASTGFLVGLVLGVIGLIIVLAWKPGLPAAPAGMRSVKCPRCNAVQNMPAADDYFECWQCHTTTNSPPPPYIAQAKKPT
jgi:hypothetical protein